MLTKDLKPGDVITIKGERYVFIRHHKTSSACIFLNDNGQTVSKYFVGGVIPVDEEDPNAK